MNVKTPIYFNGKFYSAPPTGVHRVADRLIREIDQIVGEQPQLAERLDLRLLIPRDRPSTPSLTSFALVEQRRGGSQFWEQVVAPWAARDGMLVNLCNLSPLAHRKKLTLIHDAQFFLFPGSYPLKFRLGYQALTPLIGRSSAAVVTISEYSREMLDLFGVSPRDRTVVIYNGADHILENSSKPEVVQELGLRAGKFVVLFGSAAPYKNIEVVLEAFNDPDLADLDLVVVGSSEAELRKAGLSLPARAIFAGQVDDGALRALYEQALCLAYPSRTEGFGLPPVEAMLCGAPAVTSPGGAIPEICGDAVIYANIAHPQTWVRAFRRLADDPQLAAEKRRQGLERAKPYAWRRAGQALLDLILKHAA